jgi:hypothetical protein
MLRRQGADTRASTTPVPDGDLLKLIPASRKILRRFMFRSGVIRSFALRSWYRRTVPVLLAVFACLADVRAAARATCIGDCDGNGEVSVNELIVGVNIALDLAPTTMCEAMDRNGDAMVSIDELLAAVNTALDGCPPRPTSTASPTSPTATSTSSPPATPTATLTPSPTETVTTTPSLTPTTSATSPVVPSATPTPTVPLTPIPFPAGPVQPILQNLPAALLSIAGTSAADVYAVGADANDGTGPLVLHYNGQSWQRLTTGATGGLWWISVTPIDGDFYMAGGEGRILRHTPASGAFLTPMTPSRIPTLFGIWGSDASHIWAVGGDLTEQDTGGVVWRFDGTTWGVDTTLANFRPAGLPILYKVWGRNQSDVYVSGRLGLVLHFDGTQWAQVNVEANGIDLHALPLFTVHGNATQVAVTGGVLNGVIYELAGMTFENRATAGIPQMNGIFVRPDGTGVVVGVGGAVAFRNASAWELQRPGLNTPLDLHGTWVDPDGGVWAVGGDLSSLDHGMVVYGGTATVGSTVTTSP